MCQIPDGTHFSFSALETYEQCPMSFKLKYIDGVPDEGNAFSDFGLLCHKLLEEWAKGETPEMLLAAEYEDCYDDAMRHPFPPFPRGMGEKYYDAGLDYFTNFKWFDGYDVVSAEQISSFDVTVRGKTYPFVGVIDLVLRNQKTGDLVVIDHKSKSAKQMKKDMAVYTRQLYIYARFVKDLYGAFPKRMGFNLFREGGEIVWVDFTKAGYEETMAWIVKSIEAILDEKEWKVSVSSFFCRFVCSVMDSCPAKDAVLYGGKRDESA